MPALKSYSFDGCGRFGLSIYLDSVALCAPDQRQASHNGAHIDPGKEAIGSSRYFVRRPARHWSFNMQVEYRQAMEFTRFRFFRSCSHSSPDSKAVDGFAGLPGPSIQSMIHSFSRLGSFAGGSGKPRGVKSGSPLRHRMYMQGVSSSNLLVECAISVQSWAHHCAGGGDERAQQFAFRAHDANFFRVHLDALSERAAHRRRLRSNLESMTISISDPFARLPRSSTSATENF